MPPTPSPQARPSSPSKPPLTVKEVADRLLALPAGHIATVLSVHPSAAGRTPADIVAALAREVWEGKAPRSLLIDAADDDVEQAVAKHLTTVCEELLRVPEMLRAEMLDALVAFVVLNEPMRDAEQEVKAARHDVAQAKKRCKKSRSLKGKARNSVKAVAGLGAEKEEGEEGEEGEEETPRGRVTDELVAKAEASVSRWEQAKGAFEESKKRCREVEKEAEALREEGREKGREWAEKMREFKRAWLEAVVREMRDQRTYEKEADEKEADAEETAGKKTDEKMELNEITKDMEEKVKITDGDTKTDEKVEVIEVLNQTKAVK